MQIDILISTYNEGINKVHNLLLPPDIEVNYVISHQITDPSIDVSNCDFLHRPDVKYSPIRQKGLSLNRNNSILQSSGDICFIADDDVRYNITAIKTVAKRFSENPDLDVYVGKIKTYDGEAEYKNYRNHEKVLGWSDIGSVSSIEMVIKREAIIKAGIQFDKRFGLGGILFPKGEEAIFLSDCLKNKLIIKYYPDYIVKHPKESSASSVSYDEKETEYMGALNFRIFRNMAFLSSIFFCYKHHKRYHHFLSPFEFLLNFFKGIRKMKKSKP